MATKSEISAINDPRLKDALVSKSIPESKEPCDSEKRSHFQGVFQRLLNQISDGCSQESCTFRYCRNSMGKLSKQPAAMVALQLAALDNPSRFFCPNFTSSMKNQTSVSPLVFSSVLMNSSGAYNRSQNANRSLETRLRSRSEPHFSEIFVEKESGIRKKHFRGLTEPLNAPEPLLPSTVSSLFSYAMEKLGLSRTPSNVTEDHAVDTKETIHENLKENPVSVEPYLTLSYLNSELLEGAIDTYKSSENDSAFLSNSIKTVFSSAEALSNSFCSPASSGDSKRLDLDAVCHSFNLLAVLKDGTIFIKLVQESLEKMLTELLFIVPHIKNKQDPNLNCLLISLQFLMVQPNERLVRSICLVVSKLKNADVLQRLIDTLSEYDNQSFENFVKIFKRFCENQLFASSHPILQNNPTLLAGLETLSLFYVANESSSSDTFNSNPIIPLQSFYIQESSKLNFKQEFKFWSLEFKGVFDFPFIFDAVAKARLLHLESIVQMSQQYEQAHINRALVAKANQFLLADSQKLEEREGIRNVTQPYLILQIRRENFVADVFDQIGKKRRDLKKPLKVKFIGGGEEGMDQGGVQKEFFQTLFDKLLDPVFGMFSHDDLTRFSWFNPACLETDSMYSLIGCIFGLAVYNGCMLSVLFPPVLYKKLIGEPINLFDFTKSFPTVGKGLQTLLEWKDDNLEDVFALDFTFSREAFGVVETVPIFTDGESRAVTLGNREEYVRLYIDHVANKSIESKFLAFKKGFLDVCGGRVLQMIRSHELELIICGQAAPIDIAELKECAKYDDGYSLDHEVIKWFWSIVEEFNPEQRKRLLSFVTSSDRVPLGGLKSLLFVIQRNGPDTDRLPSSLTCFGRLLLPEYSTREKLRDRLVTAIENAQGFGLV